MPVSDEVIELAGRGDSDALRVIYEALVERIHRSVRRIVGDTDVDDVTQEVFLALFAKLGTFRGDANFATWAHRLAINEALQHLRRRKRRASVPLNDALIAREKSTDGREIRELLEIALGRIDVPLRLLLGFKIVDGLGYHEIAELLEIPEGTVGSRMNRARRELRRELVQLGWGT